MVLNMSAERVGAVETLAGQITKLSLLETSHLVQLLKVKIMAKCTRFLMDGLDGCRLNLIFQMRK